MRGHSSDSAGPEQVPPVPHLGKPGPPRPQKIGQEPPRDPAAAEPGKQWAQPSVSMSTPAQSVSARSARNNIGPTHVRVSPRRPSVEAATAVCQTKTRSQVESAACGLPKRQAPSPRRTRGWRLTVPVGLEAEQEPPSSQVDLQAVMLRQLLGEEVRGIVREEIRSALADQSVSRAQRNGNMVCGDDGLGTEGRDTVSSGGLPMDNDDFKKHAVLAAEKGGKSVEMKQWLECVRGDNDLEVEALELDMFVKRWLPCPGVRHAANSVIRFVSRLGKFEAPAPTDCLSRFVDSTVFHIMVAVLILANCWFMVIVADDALRTHNTRPSDFVFMGETIFVAVLAVEFLLKIHRYRHHYFCDEHWKYNWLDLGILIISSYFLIFSDEQGGVAWLRILRVFKLAKMLRVLKLASTVRHLRVMLSSLVNSVATLMWSLVLLSLVLFLFALAFVQRTAQYFQAQGESLSDDERRQLTEAFGSVWTAMVNLFMCITGGADGSVFYQLLIPTGLVNQLLFLCFVSFTSIAVLNIILGVFIDRAMRNISVSAEELANDHLEMERKQESDLFDLCRKSTERVNGQMTSDEWREAMRKGELSAYMDMMGIKAENFADIFQSTVEKEGCVDINRFVGVCMRMKGSASSFDMHVVLEELKLLNQRLSQHQRESRRAPADIDGN